MDIKDDPAVSEDFTSNLSGDIPPKHTLYLNGLNDKIKMELMKQSLHAAFSQFGPIVDVVMRKSYRLRAQAFIIFRDIESASKALRTMQGFPFFDKPLVSNNFEVAVFHYRTLMINHNSMNLRIYREYSMQKQNQISLLNKEGRLFNVLPYRSLRSRRRKGAT